MKTFRVGIELDIVANNSIHAEYVFVDVIKDNPMSWININQEVEDK